MHCLIDQHAVDVYNCSRSTMGRRERNHSESESEQLDDVMAWGKSKGHYYQSEEDQYSEASEEVDEAHQIYHKQQQLLDRDEFYHLPDPHSAKAMPDPHSANGASYQHQQKKGINIQYIDGQISWVIQLAKLFEAVQDEKSSYRKRVIDSYLLILLCLKQFSIPYLHEHPLVESMEPLRRGLARLEQQFQQMSIFDDSNPLDSQAEQSQSGDKLESQSGVRGHSSESSGQENDDGIEIYERIKQQNETIRRQRKLENAKKRSASFPKTALETVKQNESRLASEKIVKNKGLIRKRKKIDSNSRVKLRQKYRKSIIRRRAKGHIGVRNNPGRFYEGENKVNHGKIASIKLK